MLLSLVSGCGAVETGTVGISVNSAGEIVAVVDGCGERMTWALLTEEGDSPDGVDDKELAEWQHSSKKDAPESLSWPLTGELVGSRLTSTAVVSRSSFGNVDAYTLFVGTDDPSVNIGEIRFEGSDLAVLKPGKVLMGDLENWDVKNKDFTPHVGIPEDLLEDPLAFHTVSDA